jgi:uncharacterized ferritin-like protein (DUF455 family)
MISALDQTDIFKKLQLVEHECHSLLLSQTNTLPATLKLNQPPGRNINLRSHNKTTEKIGLQTPAGQARLLHDLANIELQAMELGLRTLYEFPDAPKLFREQLVSIVLDEARHLKLCLQGLATLNYSWGDFPVHTQLWDATAADDTLVDRILIVHCYLEGSGLDSGDTILNKLRGVINKQPRDIVKVIADEEVHHVRFGLNWFRTLCTQNGQQPAEQFVSRLQFMQNRIPRRAAKINPATRSAAGFSQNEIEFLKNY